METNNQQTPILSNELNQAQQSPQIQQLEESLIAYRQSWVDEIEKMNEMMKTIPKVDELLNTIYTKRQKLVDYYYGMAGVIAKQSREYKKSYMEMFNNVKLNGYKGMRIATDQAISKLIEVELADKKEIIDLLQGHNEYIQESIKTVDNMIYGINQKIKVQEIMNGLKF